MRQSGFEDAEDTKHPLRPLMTWHSLKWQKMDPERFRAKQIYFEDATRFLDVYDFETSQEKTVWALHAEGMSVREIEKQLNLSRNQVHKIVVYLRETMRDWGDD